ncbi:MAG: hypothetical protein U0840_11495 [Gemmataceae bacterium]
MSRYEPEAYQADGGVSVLGLPLVVGSLVVTGVVLGWLASFLGQWIYLIVIFPGAMGFALFFAGLFGAKIGKLRNMALAVLLGFFAGAITLGTMHYCDYLRDVPPQPSFLAYLHHAATEGISIGRGGSGFNIGYVGTWIYWVLEYLAVSILAFLGIAVQVAEPFCRPCNRWMETRELGRLEPSEVDLTEMIEQGDIESLRDHLSVSTTGNLILSASACPECRDEGPICLKLEALSHNEKGEESRNHIITLVYPGEALADLDELFASARPRKKKKRRRRDDDYDE